MEKEKGREKQKGERERKGEGRDGERSTQRAEGEGGGERPRQDSRATEARYPFPRYHCFN